MHLDAATLLLQWATGGLAFLWITTRGRLVSLGYGWLLRSVYGVLALGGIGAELRSGHTGAGHTWFLVGSVGLVAGALVALVVSVIRRGAGVREAHAARLQSEARVAAMAGGREHSEVDPPSPRGREFPPALDLVAPVAGIVGLLGAAAFTGGSFALAAARLVVGALFLGVVTDAMLLGHWYLTQPGLPRAPLKELVRWSAYMWPAEVLVMLLPPGMIGVLNSSRSDGYAITTAILFGVTWLALRERFYSAVMAATGLLYLAILTAFGTDLVARALLAP